jgi:hypothetical protein
MVNKDKGLVMHVSLSEEGKKEAQRIAKSIADRMDALKYSFLQMGDKNNIPPISKPLEGWMKANPVLVKPRMMDSAKSIRLAMEIAKPCPVQDELIEWLKEQQKNEIFKREYMCHWVDIGKGEENGND